MKKLLVITASLLLAASSWAQGTFQFTNFATGTEPVNAPIKDATLLNTPNANGPTYSAVFYVAAAGVTDPTQFTLVATSTTPLQSGAGAGYFLGGQQIVPGFAAGTTINVLVRAFDTTKGGTYATSTVRGTSNIVPVTLVAGTDLPHNLVGLQGFSVNVVPEPSTIALGVIGAAALLLRRRRA